MIIMPEDKAIISILSAEDAGHVLLALVSDDESSELSVQAKVVYTVIYERNKRISERKSKAGKTGGAPQNNQNAKKQAEQADEEKTSETSHRTDTVTVPNRTDTEPEEQENGAAAPIREEKHKRGKFGWVKLTDSEYQRLISEFGEDTAQHYIAYVDESAQQTGNKNKWKDWNLTVRKAIKNKWGGGLSPPEPTDDERFRLIPDD